MKINLSTQMPTQNFAMQSTSRRKRSTCVTSEGRKLYKAKGKHSENEFIRTNAHSQLCDAKIQKKRALQMCKLTDCADCTKRKIRSARPTRIRRLAVGQFLGRSVQRDTCPM